MSTKKLTRLSDGPFILENAACGLTDANDEMALASCTCYVFLDAEGKAWVFALLAEVDLSFD